MKPSKNEDSSKVNKLPQAQDYIVEDSFDTYVEKEAPNEDACECMREKNSEKEKCIEVKEKKRVEEKERLSKRKNECFNVKQESAKEEQKVKEIVVLEKSDEVNIYANGTNSFFATMLILLNSILMLPALLWIFEGIDSRMNPFQERGYDVKTNKDHSTISVEVTSGIKSFKTSWLKASEKEFQVQI
ncbi:hypothetical protein M9H77_18173 [Catharanthus roseus]|uniref:Uncharacterized protein n=1 Tax=Catharanthus roseus TaxID=4058 RepID=A0ACC0B6Q0_CATRO|nr:hypothetical protein M9H77_18173 [Catharanthus roseus]